MMAFHHMGHAWPSQLCTERHRMLSIRTLDDARQRRALRGATSMRRRRRTGSVVRLCSNGKADVEKEEQERGIKQLVVKDSPDEMKKSGIKKADAYVETKTEPESEPSLVAAISLVAGTMIGAGILALPSVTWKAGFLPSSAALLGGWVYMTTAAFLVAETSLFTMRKNDRPTVSFLSMTDEFLGTTGSRISSAFYLFIMVSLMVAYIAQAGGILAESAQAPYWQGASVFALGVGGFLFAAKQELVESTNNALVGILVVTFGALVVLASPGVHLDYLAGRNWAEVIPALPTILVALVYHQIVPVICAQLEGDIPKIRVAIVVGTLLPLSMFIVWNAVILGSVAPDFLSQFLVSGETLDPLALLRQGGDQVGATVSVFSELAIITSFIGFVYGFVDFIVDVSNTVPNSTARRALNFRPLQFSLALFPALGGAIAFPGLFFKAIDLTGTFGMTILFGVIPATMAGKLRRMRKQEETEGSGTAAASENGAGASASLVPGGDLTLALMILGAVSIIVNELWELLAV